MAPGGFVEVEDYAGAMMASLIYQSKHAKQKPGSPIRSLGDDGEDCEDSRSAIRSNKRPRDSAG